MRALPKSIRAALAQPRRPHRPPPLHGRLRMAARLYDGPIVDPHIHLWDRSLNRHAWLEGAREAPLARDQLPADYWEAAAGQNVVATVRKVLKSKK